MNIDELVEQRLVTLMKKDPAKLLTYLVVIAGREAVSANVNDFEISLDCDIEGSRYKIVNKIEVIKL